MHPSVLEGLLEHALPASGPEGAALGRTLREAGLPGRLAREGGGCTSDVLLGCLELACREVLPALPREEAMHALGVRFASGFLHTLLGRMVGATLPVLGPEGFLKRLPRLFALAAPSSRIAVHQEGPGAWRLEVWDPCPLPDFAAGLVAQGLAVTGTAARVRVAERRAGSYVLQARW
jgi:uncharacterized protein (TIGR02265 family)